ncbi:MAG TPA: TauD/TfdA family dioxygenase [Euzebyales bacterium]|nr:TauD/TfdA family dioxygenase [Euzebyales bacterium]
MDQTSTTAVAQAAAAGVRVGPRTLTVELPDGVRTFHYVWLRDNCWCGSCRVQQTAERKLFTADIAADVSPARARLDDRATLHVEWNDGHRSAYTAAWLVRYDYGDAARAARRHDPVLWAADFTPPAFAHADVVGGVSGQLAYLDALRDVGVAIVRDVPTVPGEAARFASTLGHVREVAFERVHNVRHDPDGYNVAHTPLELKPHTDMPSYAWPPSVQLIHFLVNRADGGESVVVDGWRVLGDLRRDHPDAFAVLASVPVPYQLFSASEDTYAVAPMVQLDPEGRVTTFRFSNQLACPLDVAADVVEPFYAAYRRLGAMIDGPDYRVVFKAVDGDLLTLHGHRVLHGRLPFDPTSGARHLQDVYMEWDDLMARRRVLRGEHRPLPATMADAS